MPLHRSGQFSICAANVTQHCKVGVPEQGIPYGKIQETGHRQQAHLSIWRNT